MLGFFIFLFDKVLLMTMAFLLMFTLFNIEEIFFRFVETTHIRWGTKIFKKFTNLDPHIIIIFNIIVVNKVYHNFESSVFIWGGGRESRDSPAWVRSNLVRSVCLHATLTYFT